MVVRILIGALCGVVFGTFFPAQAVQTEFIGKLFLNALRMMVLPLIITSLIVGITGVADPKKLGSLGIKTFAYYFITTCIAVFIGICVVVSLTPGAGYSVAGVDFTRSVSMETPSMLGTLMRLVHPNLVQAASEFKILPLILASVLFGAALIALGKEGKGVIDFIRVINKAVMKIVHWIIFFTPVGVFGLIAYRIGMAGGGEAVFDLFIQLGKYVAVVMLGLSLHGIIVLPLILYLFAKHNPLDYAVKLSKAFMTAFGTSSSSATLPVTMECVKQDAKVDEKVSDVVLPIGATVNMDGTALYEAVAVIFIAQAYGIQLGMGDLLTIFITANLAAVGAAGIPEAGLVTMVLVLESVGLPVEGIGLILAIDWLLDRCRTVVNVWGDAIGAAVISRFQKT